MKKIFTNGCFDILHRGHVELLKFCKTHGKVIVGLNSDESVRLLKGIERPINNEQDRKFMLESCRFVDEVIIFNDETPIKLIQQINPDLIVKGGDYKAENVIGRNIAEVIIYNYVDGYSTTKLIEKIKK